MCLVYVLCGVVSALLTGLLSDGQTQRDAGASCYRRYTSPAVVLLLVIFSLVSSKIPPRKQDMVLLTELLLGPLQRREILW